MKNKKYLVFIVLLLFPLLLLTQETEKKFATDYKIGPKDLIEISVFGLAELSLLTRRVSQDGKITLPLIGEIEVEGLTTTDIEKKLAGLLEEKYLQNPQLSVIVKEFRSKRISVMGAVTTPGQYDLLGRQTLLGIISEAGGFTPEAGNYIIIIRVSPDGTSSSIRIPLDDLILKGDAQYNIPLEPGDIVNVPEDKLVTIYMLGQVRSPGAIQVKRSNVPNILQAIAQAGGFSERANKTRIVVKRKDDKGKEIQININVKEILRGKKPPFQLKENDTVFVPETVF